jgi:hypothetical protein
VSPIDERKVCKCCNRHTIYEDEKHFLLVCTAFSVPRSQFLADTLRDMINAGLVQEWLSFCTAELNLCCLIMLGRLEHGWRLAASEIFDKYLRSFLLASV